MSITPLAAALAARPVPPRTPTKDYADVWLPVTLGTLAVVLVLLGLLALGWRARRRAQAGIPAPAPVPTATNSTVPASWNGPPSRTSSTARRVNRGACSPATGSSSAAVGRCSGAQVAAR